MGTYGPFSKGPEHKFRQFKTLQAEWNANDRTTQNNTSNYITDSRNQSTKHEPDEVSNEIQMNSDLYDVLLILKNNNFPMLKLNPNRY